MVAQSLLLCIVISSVGGIFMAASNAVVARMKKQPEVDFEATTRSKLHNLLFVSTFIFFSGLAYLCIVFAPWFGPVSIYWPAYTAAKLLSNLVLIGFIMKQEQIDNNKVVGTMIVVMAVLYITITGPRTQDEDSMKEMILGNPIAMIWIGVLAIAYVICSVNSRSEG